MTQPVITDGRRKIFGLHPNVFFLGVVSLLTDISSEMIFTIIPLFLRNVLNASVSVVGIVGGVTEGADAIIRIFSGWFSDRIGKRKALAVAGYSLSTLVKPFMYLANSWGAVLGVRLGDRIGKGLRSSSRDALIADSLAANERGKGFGFHRAMDTSGAVLGLAIGAVIVYLVQGGGLKLELRTYQWMVMIGVVPAVLAVIVLLTMVREKKKESATGAKAAFPLSGITKGFEKRFWLFLVVIAIFTLGNSSDFFLILRAQGTDTPLIQVMLWWLYQWASSPIKSDGAGLLRQAGLYMQSFTSALPWHPVSGTSGYSLRSTVSITVLLKALRRLLLPTWCPQNGEVQPTGCIRAWSASCSFLPVSLPAGCGRLSAQQRLSTSGQDWLCWRCWVSHLL
jgi:hypothetical protein